MTRFAAIHQFHPGAVQGDAITQQMLWLQRELRALGYNSLIFAKHVAPGVRNQVFPIETYSGSDQNLLFVHHSLGYDALDDVIALPDEVVAVYHNVTPECFFTDPTIRELIRLGHDQLRVLARRARAGIADSNYNRREMLRVGFHRVEVLPVRTDYSDFVATQAEVRPHSSDWLYVGRIVGNKCQHDLVAAFAEYTDSFDPAARLLLIGDTSLSDYVEQVEQRALDLGVADRVSMFGKVSDAQLKAAYAGAGVFVSLSEHEGFGVPILEAMAAGVPVIAFAAAAVPETMGGAGILLRSKDPALVAATVQAIRLDPGMRNRLIARQRTRVQKVQDFDTGAAIERAIQRANGTRIPLSVQVQGPFETSYSLAVANRNLATQLNSFPDRSVSIYPTEGPGDYEPNLDQASHYPQTLRLYERSEHLLYPHVVIRQMYPPRVIDSPGAITCEYFGWEESRIPESMAQDFNQYLDGVGVMSEFVRGVLRSSGVEVPIRVVGVGVDPPDNTASAHLPELQSLRSFVFLNIGSGFLRKGVDILLEAYFSSFDGSDDVSLIIKTFPNQHNNVKTVLDSLRARFANPPDVRWIDRDLVDSELHGLYNLARCYVHPARGEGFGLPVAEAMLASVPVISVAYSGLAEFVSEDTATTIPYSVEPAMTHLSVDGSSWAEPDVVALAQALRDLFEKADSEAIRLKADRARDLVAREFSWEAVTHRWSDFLSELEDAAPTPRVAMVSTWNSRCGVAENTKKIVDHAGATIDFEVIADRGVVIIDPVREAGVARTWRDRWSPDLSDLQNELNLSQAEVVHFQFHFGFFELGRFAALIEDQLPRRGVVITFHRTSDIELDGEMVSLRSISDQLKRVDGIIVHQPDDAALLALFGIKENVRVVPIGTDPPPLVSPDEARSALGLEGRPLIGTFGFLLPHKGTLELLRAVDALRTEYPDLCLIALCARYPAPLSTEYEARVRAELEARKLLGHVILITDYLPDEEIRATLRAVDAIVLPYGPTEESSSAALRFVLPVERPIIVTDQPIFHDARDDILVVEQSGPVSMEDAIRRVLADTALAKDLASRASAAAQRFRWSRVVADHREIYTKARRAHGIRS